ncbi:2-amino-4-hydroxy-6-hydroxymethyldihydropteridine diphosphokinase [Cyclobacterium qasimii]|uniref:2-amino-4-hydroxy-6-hydroxymethyldihydropteridine pyrophosphokinase n=2 Tax=Cyclobacterium qasimii TaxID=1350429 RepID=S7VM72_9BACT|nr:2-amino-4-hydroxy-6-hydroxymethyldihydropteridine diphosphokinase [Cyclobacterium qasimii]EPR71280.1 2-amino-4-hydroxy-6- hydroxymethyldihydropteridine pyrophosphokinase [Cyclobacterium qasimii M12-11B]GEO23304.1 2-amino-4-hydroxy-6-hydroxymethyldihydropteridine diphosphokinase [Cyclobacterium qasimii]
MHQVVLGLGGNMGDRLSLLNKAGKLLSQKMMLVRESTIYQTAAWGGKSEAAYLNQVLVMKTSLSALDCLDFILDIENQLGRKRFLKWGDRTMDIDILYFDNEIINTEKLKVPHPHLASRNFVLVPLAEILPDFVHPQIEKSSMVLMEECEDCLKVKKWHNLAE